MEKFANKERVKLECNKTVPIGMGLGVEPEWSPEETLEENKVLNRDMLANRERHKLERYKAVPIGKGLGVEPK